jgi:dipeptidase E
VKQILAFGGGGFSMEASTLIDEHVISLARDGSPRVCFVPTASADAAGYITRFYRLFSLLDCIPSDLTLLGAFGLPRRPGTDAEIEEFLCEQDVIYVGGGNTANMLALWRAHGVDRALRKAWESGTVLAGLSAGMICWFECAVTDSYGPLAPMHDCLGLLPGSACPHYDSETQRRPRYHELIADGLPAGYAADDGVALHFVDDKLHEVVASRPSAQAYRVELQGGRVVETALAPRYLG